MTAAWLGDPAESRARSTTPKPGPSFFAPALFVSRGRPLGRSARTPCARAVSAARDSATRAELTRTRPFVHAARGCASRWVRRVMTASTDFDGAIRGDSRDPRRFGRVERPAVLRHHGWLTDDLDRRSDRRMVTHVAILCTTHSARSPPGPPLRPPPAPTHDPPALTPAAVLGLSPSGAIASAPLDGADIASTSARVAAATTFASSPPPPPPPPPVPNLSLPPPPDRRPERPVRVQPVRRRQRVHRRERVHRGDADRVGVLLVDADSLEHASRVREPRPRDGRPPIAGARPARSPHRVPVLHRELFEAFEHVRGSRDALEERRDVLRGVARGAALDEDEVEKI